MRRHIVNVPVDKSAIVVVLEIVEQIPAAGGYVIAMVGFSVFAWILMIWARSSQRSFTESQRSMQGVVTMSEDLRAAMRLDMERCEEKCRRCEEEIKIKDDVIEQLRTDRDELI